MNEVVLKNETVKSSSPQSGKDHYELISADRQGYVDLVLSSSALKKVIIAGPGTGKTHLFQKILENKKNSLTLTFVNALVKQLSLELYGLSEVRTLHGYARKIIKEVAGKDVSVFPGLTRIIQEDINLVFGNGTNFEKVFRNLENDNEDVARYEQRRGYYGGSFDYTDLIFSAVKYLKDNPNKIPKHGQIAVDEFQDFNKLEVTLIDLLATNSPVLLVGDDDQALYKELKDASADFIRERYSGQEPGYEPFDLPYCSRSTKVIVDTVNDVVAKAKSFGYLQKRRDKPYQYFACKSKDTDSDTYKKITHAKLPKQDVIPWFVDECIKKITKTLRSEFSVLIISPSGSQCEHITKGLNRKGYHNVQYIKGKPKPTKLSILLSGTKILLNEPYSNLGWRLVCQALLNKPKLDKLIRESFQNDTKRMYDLVDPAVAGKMQHVISLIKNLANGEDIEEGDFKDVLTMFGIDLREVGRSALMGKVAPPSEMPGNLGTGALPITVTTVQSAKGLAADFVFVTHFDDRYLTKGKTQISDQAICNFIVALTRARKKIFLISVVAGEDAKFLDWVEQDRVEKYVMKAKR